MGKLTTVAARVVVAKRLNDGWGILVGLDPKKHAHQMPGGKRERGESSKRAAARETREETGLRIAPKKLQLVHRFKAPELTRDTVDYYLAVVEGSPTLADSAELKNLRFVPSHELGGLDPPLTATSAVFWRQKGPTVLQMLGRTRPRD